VYLDEQLYASGGGDSGPWCCACKGPILKGQDVTRLEFDTDPNGARGLSGDYHRECSKPFVSLAHALSALSRFGR
jgi:hypothetical protein